METQILIAILLMFLVTVLPRILPAWILGGITYPKKLVIWLKYVPAAIIAALLAPEIVLIENKIALDGSNLFFWVSIPTFAIAVWTRNLFATLLCGMGALALLRFSGL